jgi:hypothetical protein
MFGKVGGGGGAAATSRNKLVHVMTTTALVYCFVVQIQGCRLGTANVCLANSAVVHCRGGIKEIDWDIKTNCYVFPVIAGGPDSSTIIQLNQNTYKKYKWWLSGYFDVAVL